MQTRTKTNNSQAATSNARAAESQALYDRGRVIHDELKADPPAATPTAARAAAEKGPNLTDLLLKCFTFDATADMESRQLLSQILDRWTDGYRVGAIMASESLSALGVYIGVDKLDDENFTRLLELFDQAVSGHGYYGVREQLITRFLEGADRDRNMTIERALAIVVLEFQEKESLISAARQALKDYPDDLASSIEKSLKSSPTLRDRIASKLREQ